MRRTLLFTPQSALILAVALAPFLIAPAPVRSDSTPAWSRQSSPNPAWAETDLRNVRAVSWEQDPDRALERLRLEPRLESQSLSRWRERADLGSCRLERERVGDGLHQRGHRDGHAGPSLGRRAMVGRAKPQARHGRRLCGHLGVHGFGHLGGGGLLR